LVPGLLTERAHEFLVVRFGFESLGHASIAVDDVRCQSLYFRAQRSVRKNPRVGQGSQTACVELVQIPLFAAAKRAASKSSSVTQYHRSVLQSAQ